MAARVLIRFRLPPGNRLSHNGETRRVTPAAALEQDVPPHSLKY